MSDELDILLVEDDLDTQANLIDILTLDGHRVRAASSYEDVLKVGVQPDISLVVLDRRLPDGVAEDRLPELQRLLPHAEFVVVTGFADMETTIAAFKLGVVDYILKPIHPGVIRQSIGRIVRQRRIEAEFRAEQRFANEVLETAEAVILVLDLEGKIIRFNPYFTQISGWKLEEIQGQDWFETCIPKKDHAWVRKVFMDTASDVHTTGVLNPILTSDDSQRQIRWSNNTLKNERGESTAVLSIGVDVTELLDAQELAMRAQRLAAIGQTVAGLAHESRNALHRIQASSEILSLDVPPNSDASEEIDSIKRAAIELNNTLEEVRLFAAPIHLRREEASLPGIWRRVWGYLESSPSAKTGKLHEEFAGDCEQEIDVDVLRMEQVFRNLFENSLAAATEEARVSITYSSGGGNTVLITVRDNGPGLTAEQKEKVFEPFFTTKSRGTGLGMSIVQRIIEAHKGDIWVGDEEGTGACFYLRLPIRPIL